ncbi:hypothetical protein LZ31DRAFT_133769 [Colletotrichum somersetense]|nr:hypothetical protein LZ31DRAFT_133769 [Colletotrichum somersetense]
MKEEDSSSNRNHDLPSSRTRKHSNTYTVTKFHLGRKFSFVLLSFLLVLLFPSKTMPTSCQGLVCPPVLTAPILLIHPPPGCLSTTLPIMQNSYMNRMIHTTQSQYNRSGTLLE